MRHPEDLAERAEQQVELWDDDDSIEEVSLAISWLGNPTLRRHPLLLAASRLERTSRDCGILEDEDY